MGNSVQITGKLGRYTRRSRHWVLVLISCSGALDEPLGLLVGHGDPFAKRNGPFGGHVAWLAPP